MLINDFDIPTVECMLEYLYTGDFDSKKKIEDHTAPSSSTGGDKPNSNGSTLAGENSRCDHGKHKILMLQVDEVQDGSEINLANEEDSVTLPITMNLVPGDSDSKVESDPILMRCVTVSIIADYYQISGLGALALQKADHYVFRGSSQVQHDSVSRAAIFQALRAAYRESGYQAMQVLMAKAAASSIQKGVLDSDFCNFPDVDFSGDIGIDLAMALGNCIKAMKGKHDEEIKRWDKHLAVRIKPLEEKIADLEKKKVEELAAERAGHAETRQCLNSLTDQLSGMYLSSDCANGGCKQTPRRLVRKSSEMSKFVAVCSDCSRTQSS